MSHLPVLYHTGPIHHPDILIGFRHFYQLRCDLNELHTTQEPDFTTQQILAW